MKKIFGTDGVRGIALTELSCDLAYKIGCATAIILKKSDGAIPKVLLGCDPRASSTVLAMSVFSGLCTYGADVVYLGTVSTPCVSYLTTKYGADASVMISASHNSSEYNGIKIFGKQGIKLPDQTEEKIEELIKALPSPDIFGHIGSVSAAKAAISDYTEHLKSCAGVSFNGLKLAIDCANGSAAITAKKIFTDLGADVTMLSDTPSGYNINKNCGSTHIEALQKSVLDNGLDCGIAFDGDADRCIMVDEKGNMVDGDAIMAICALDMKKRGLLENNTLVATVMSNFGLMKFCEENGILAVLTSVGDRYVCETMQKHGYTLGGEQSGHIIFGEHAVTGDGQLTAIIVLSILMRGKKSLSDAASVMKRYPQSLVNVKADDQQKSRFKSDETISERIQILNESLQGNGRILVRASGTEPLIRIMAEGACADDVTKITKELADFISDKIK